MFAFEANIVCAKMIGMLKSSQPQLLHSKIVWKGRHQEVESGSDGGVLEHSHRKHPPPVHSKQLMGRSLTDPWQNWCHKTLVPECFLFDISFTSFRLQKIQRRKQNVAHGVPCSCHTSSWLAT